MPPASCAAAAAGLRSRACLPTRLCALESFPVTPGANATKIQKAKLRELAQELLIEN